MDLDHRKVNYRVKESNVVPKIYCVKIRYRAEGLVNMLDIELYAIGLGIMLEGLDIISKN